MVKPCSECGAICPAAKHRPRDTCSAVCLNARRRRLKAEARAFTAEKRKADEANAKYLREEFGPWSRGEGWPESRPIGSIQAAPPVGAR